MGLKVGGAQLFLKGGLLNRTLHVAAMRSATLEFAAAAQNGYTNYARKSIALAGWTRTNAGKASNTAALDFPQPSSVPATVPTHFGLYSAATAGTLYAVQALTGSVTAPALGGTFGFDAGELVLNLRSGAVTGRGLRKAFESGLLSGTTYIALYSQQPPSSGQSNQIDDRIQMAAADWTEDSSNRNQAKNANIINFGVQATNVARPTHVGLQDSARNLLWWDQFDTRPADPNIGATLSIAADAITIGFVIDA